MKETIKETLTILYQIEEHLEYNKTELGKNLGVLIEKLQKKL